MGDRKRYALFLDFDGTLVDIAPTPDAVDVSPALRADLDQLRSALDGALALVSGRKIATLDAFMAPLQFDAAGLHGLEIRCHGRTLEHAPPSPRLRAVATALEHRLLEFPKALVEDKRQSVAIHWRLAPEAEEAIHAMLDDLAITLGSELRIQHGKAVAEILPVGAHKGAAIEALMKEPAYAGRTPVVFGDDVTDEDAFRIVNALGGYSVKVGEEKTAATFRVPNARTVRALLARWAQRLPEDVVGELSGEGWG